MLARPSLHFLSICRKPVLVNVTGSGARLGQTPAISFDCRLYRLHSETVLMERSCYRVRTIRWLSPIRELSTALTTAAHWLLDADMDTSVLILGWNTNNMVVSIGNLPGEYSTLRCCSVLSASYNLNGVLEGDHRQQSPRRNRDRH